MKIAEAFILNLCLKTENRDVYTFPIRDYRSDCCGDYLILIKEIRNCKDSHYFCGKCFEECSFDEEWYRCSNKWLGEELLAEKIKKTKKFEV